MRVPRSATCRGRSRCICRKKHAQRRRRGRRGPTTSMRVAPTPAWQPSRRVSPFQPLSHLAAALPLSRRTPSCAACGGAPVLDGRVPHEVPRRLVRPFVRRHPPARRPATWHPRRVRVACHVSNAGTAWCSAAFAARGMLLHAACRRGMLQAGWCVARHVHPSGALDVVGHECKLLLVRLQPAHPWKPTA